MLHKKLPNSLLNSKKSVENYHLFHSKRMNDSSEINKYLEEIIIGVHELMKGKLSPFLVPPHVLKHTICQIQIILIRKSKFFFFYLTHTNPTHYYSNANILYTRQHSLNLGLKFSITM